jgi:peroxiredoxin
MIDLSALPGRTVVYAYPRTGKPAVANPPGWDMIPGARGCTPQSCSFRDHFAELKRLGVKNLFGLSTQDPAYQREAVERLRLPFAILSDEHLALTGAMKLPTFQTSGMMLLKRFTLVIEDGIITHVFYPVFPPDRSAADVVEWLSSGRDGSSRWPVHDAKSRTPLAWSGQGKWSARTKGYAAPEAKAAPRIAPIWIASTVSKNRLNQKMNMGKAYKQAIKGGIIQVPGTQ